MTAHDGIAADLGGALHDSVILDSGGVAHDCVAEHASIRADVGSGRDGRGAGLVTTAICVPHDASRRAIIPFAWCRTSHLHLVEKARPRWMRTEPIQCLVVPAVVEDIRRPCD